MWDIVRDLGGGLYHPFLMIFSERFHNVEVKVYEQGREKLTEYKTPLGTVSTKHVLTSAMAGALQPYQTEYMLEQADDYDVVEYIIENTKLTPNYNEFLELEDEFGEDGVVFADSGNAPIHRLMRDLMGYERFFFELHDHPAKVERLLDILTCQSKEVQEIAADSPADIIRIGGNFSDAVTSPPLFAKYFVPYFQEFSMLMHSRGKIVVSHTDGEMKRLLSLFLKTGIDVAEAFTPTPMTNCTLTEARETWGDKITIWGGVPSIFLCDGFSDEEFESYMLNLFKEIAPGNNFILGLGDNLPADGQLERLARIADLVDKYGEYPINVR
jgi:uroporphyrinogen-III decarboxylase